MADQQELDKAQQEFHLAAESAGTALNNLLGAVHDTIRGVFTHARAANAPVPSTPIYASPEPVVEPDLTETAPEALPNPPEDPNDQVISQTIPAESANSILGVSALTQEHDSTAVDASSETSTASNPNVSDQQ